MCIIVEKVKRAPRTFRRKDSTIAVNNRSCALRLVGFVDNFAESRKNDVENWILPARMYAYETAPLTERLTMTIDVGYE